jgi:glycosyltransferase involved in cell wall biosynthesis
MQLSRADVVLLNSDTIVTPGWLDAIMHCAATDARIGTITPFSNNAEICSFPRFCENNPWPPGADPARAQSAIAAAAAPVYPDLPTGVGFCLYLRRALVDDVGVFDMAFGAGYGEENDLCLRAARAGWRNVLADNAFVVHTGERSFAGRKAEVASRNMALLLERHPHYMDMVREYIVADPLRPIRHLAEIRLAIDASPGRGVLHVIHHHGGGTETHVRALVAGTRERWRNYIAIAVGDRWQVEAHLADGRVLTVDLTRDAHETWTQFIGGICASFDVALVHLHNISGCRDGILAALPELSVPFGYTIHDLNFACPTITLMREDGMFCGGVTDPAVCASCLRSQPDFAHIDIVRWRERHDAVVRKAVFRLAPSQWAAAMAARYFPGAPVAVVPHGAPEPAHEPAHRPRSVMLLPRDDVPTVAIVGAIGPDKGARRLERLVALARERNARLRFVLIGYMDFQHGPWQSDDALFTVHGHYVTSDLPDLFEHYHVALVLYPSAGPETFSYTLTEAWSEGRPVLVPPIGALAERVAGTGAGWVMSDEEWRDESHMLDRLQEVLAPSSQRQLALAAERARSMPHVLLAQMTEQTERQYEIAVANAPSRTAARKLEPGRLVYGLGYRPWHPPVLPRSRSRPRPRSLLRRLARRGVVARLRARFL